MIHTQAVNTLFLDLAGKDQVMAIADDTRVCAMAHIIDHRDETILLSTLDRVLQESSLTKKDLHRLAVVTGPGGFTTVRVGIAMMNALAFVLQLPMAGIHGSDVYAARTTEKDFVWVHSTRKTQLFIRGFGTYKKTWPEPTLITTDALNLSAVSYVGELLPEHEAMLSQRHCQSLPLQPLETILPALLSAQTYHTGSIQPWYGRGI